MMVIVRVYPTGSKDELWNCLTEVVPKLRIKDTQPLYISQQDEYDYVSIVFDAHSFEAMVPVFCEGFRKCEDIDFTRTSPLMNPIFFPVPKDRPKELHRFRLAIRVNTRYLRRNFKRLAQLTYRDDIFPTYQALSLGDNDILISILAPSSEAIEAVVTEKIKTLEGIKEVKITFVNKNLRITSGDEWKYYRESHYQRPAPEGADAGFDWLDAAISGAFTDEF